MQQQGNFLSGDLAGRLASQLDGSRLGLLVVPQHLGLIEQLLAVQNRAVCAHAQIPQLHGLIQAVLFLGILQRQVNHRHVLVVHGGQNFHSDPVVLVGQVHRLQEGHQVVPQLIQRTPERRIGRHAHHAGQHDHSSGGGNGDGLPDHPPPGDTARPFRTGGRLALLQDALPQLGTENNGLQTAVHRIFEIVFAQSNSHPSNLDFSCSRARLSRTEIVDSGAPSTLAISLIFRS